MKTFSLSLKDGSPKLRPKTDRIIIFRNDPVLTIDLLLASRASGAASRRFMGHTSGLLGRAGLVDRGAVHWSVEESRLGLAVSPLWLVGFEVAAAVAAP
jgi:hypothetical protein